MNNCLLFAIALYIRRRGSGNRCQIVVRRSNKGRFPHFMFKEWRRGGPRLVHYVPIQTNTGSRCRPLFSGWVKWGDRALPAPRPQLEEVVNNLRSWAKSAGPTDITCVSTKFGTLAFFRCQIDAACTYHKLETLLVDRIALAKSDRASRL